MFVCFFFSANVYQIDSPLKQTSIFFPPGFKLHLYHTLNFHINMCLALPLSSVSVIYFLHSPVNIMHLFFLSQNDSFLIQRLISHSIFLIFFIEKCVDKFVCIFSSIFLLKCLLPPTLTAFVFILHRLCFYHIIKSYTYFYSVSVLGHQHWKDVATLIS